MSTTSTKPRPYVSPLSGMEVILNAEILKPGSVRDANGKSFNPTPKDFDSMLRAYKDGVIRRIPVKVGHTSDEYNAEIAKALKIPPIMVVGENNRGAVNLGQFTNLRPGSKGGLTADIEVPKAIHGLAKQQLIRNLSMEILHNVMVNGKFYPMVVKAGCLLGRENPAIPLSDFKLSERQGFGEFSTYTLSEFSVGGETQLSAPLASIGSGLIGAGLVYHLLKKNHKEPLKRKRSNLAGPTTGDVHQPSILKKRIRNKQGNRELQLEQQRKKKHLIGNKTLAVAGLGLAGISAALMNPRISNRIIKYLAKRKKIMKASRSTQRRLETVDRNPKHIKSTQKFPSRRRALFPSEINMMRRGQGVIRNSEFVLENRRAIGLAPRRTKYTQTSGHGKNRNQGYIRKDIDRPIGAIKKLLKGKIPNPLQILRAGEKFYNSELASPSSKVWKDWKARGKPYKMYKGKRIANIINMKSGPSPADKHKEPTNNKFFPMFRNSSYLSKSQKFTNYKVPVTTVTSGQVPNKRVEVIHVKASDPSRAQTSALRLLERGFGKSFEIVGSAVGLILAVHLGKKYLIGKGVKGSDFIRKLEAPVSVLKLAENNKKKVIAGVGIGAASVIAAREARNRIKARNTKGLEKTLRSGTDAAAKSRIASRSVVDPTQRAKASSVIAKRQATRAASQRVASRAAIGQGADKKFAQAKAGAQSRKHAENAARYRKNVAASLKASRAKPGFLGRLGKAAKIARRLKR